MKITATDTSRTCLPSVLVADNGLLLLFADTTQRCFNTMYRVVLLGINKERTSRFTNEKYSGWFVGKNIYQSEIFGKLNCL